MPGFPAWAAREREARPRATGKNSRSAVAVRGSRTREEIAARHGQRPGQESAVKVDALVV